MNDTSANPEMLRVLIVDDEAPARRRLARLLAELDGIDVRGAVGDAFEALARMAAEPIDLVLLDIHMPEMDGTRLAQRLGRLTLPRRPVVVMVTAHPEHAVQAFALDVVDYLLKPVAREGLRRAIERARRRGAAEQTAPVSTSSSSSSDADADADADRGPVVRNRIVARHGGSSFLLDPDQVGYLHASHKYVITKVDGREYVFDDSLNTLERQLSAQGFVRVHRSELVNLTHVVALHVDRRGEGAVAELELRDGTSIPVSRRRLAGLRARLDL